MPQRQFLHIRDRVKDPVRFQVVHVLGKQNRTDDAATMILLLEVRVGEAEEHARELAFPDVVWEVLHRVRSQNRGVLVLTLIFLAQILDSQVHIFAKLHADFEP